MKAFQAVRPLFTVFVALFGSNLRDYRTGEWIAKAVVFSWGGRVYLIGLDGKDQVIPVFLPQKRLSFWKRTIGFTTHPAPDFPHEPPSGSSS